MARLTPRRGRTAWRGAQPQGHQWPNEDAISFHSSIRRAKAFAAYEDAFTKNVTGYGALDTFHVSSKLNTSEREEELEEFGAIRVGPRSYPITCPRHLIG